MAAVFDDVEVRTETVLVAHLVDDASLNGLFIRLHDLGLQVFDARICNTDRRGAPPWT